MDESAPGADDPQAQEAGLSGFRVSTNASKTKRDGGLSFGEGGGSVGFCGLI